MDAYTFTFFTAAVCAAIIFGYLFGLRTTRKAHEVIQRKLIDAYQENDWTEKKYKVLKQNYTGKLNMITELENTNALLRKANEQVYEDGIMDGKQAGKLEFVKKLGKSLVDESNVLNGNGIVEAIPVPNQINNVKC